MPNRRSDVLNVTQGDINVAYEHTPYMVTAPVMRAFRRMIPKGWYGYAGWWGHEISFILIDTFGVRWVCKVPDNIHEWDYQYDQHMNVGPFRNGLVFKREVIHE